MLRTEIEKSKEELIQLIRSTESVSNPSINLIDRFDTFEINDKKLEDIRGHLTIFNGNLSRKLSEYKDSIIGNKEYTFEYEDIDIKSLFGSFKEIEKVI